MNDPRRIIPTGASRKEIFIAVAAAVLAVVLIGYGLMSLGTRSSQSGITGKVVEKKFVPRAETQVAVGSGGVQRADKAGLYYLHVKARDTGEIYSVLLSEEDYERAKVGDTYQIPKASLLPETGN